MQKAILILVVWLFCVYSSFSTSSIASKGQTDWQAAQSAHTEASIGKEPSSCCSIAPQGHISWHSPHSEQTSLLITNNWFHHTQV